MNKLPLYRPWFTHFVLYNFIFLGLQFGYILSQSNSFIHALPLPILVYFELLLTLFIHLTLYLLLSLFQTALIWGLMQHHLRLIVLERWQLTIWIISVCALLSSNGYFFPLSVFSQLLLPEVPAIFLELLLFFSLLVLGLLTLNALFFISKRYKVITSLSLLLSMSFVFYTSNNTHLLKQQKPKNNIIFIGVDSLSPNSISMEHTPTLARFARNSVLFKETISPLARTYPAWSSILTGLYPKHHLARYNLMPPDVVQSRLSFAWSLQQSGYQTLFATDDRRFNSIGVEFGFQRIIGPKLGVNDILLGTFNDFPLSNLMVNLPISRWLFPYNYINRASHFTYYPQSFDNALKHALSTGTQIAPSFIAVHFTLPHWPYAWAESSPAQVKDEYSVEEREQLYMAALERVDKQVANLLHVLKQFGYLENSMLVLLSDHGESLYLPGSRQTTARLYQGGHTNKFVDYLKRKTSTALEKSAGHGSDLLSPKQYHCVLAFKIYKNNQLITTPAAINTRVALIDLAPTILDFLKIPTRNTMDGISLFTAIRNNKEPLPQRAFIMESGMLPNLFLTREKARLLGQQLFTITPKGPLQLRNDELVTLDALKLYAIIEGDWVLALYPDDEGYIPVMQNLRDGTWTDELSSDFAQSSPAQRLLDLLKQFYKRDWNLVKNKA